MDIEEARNVNQAPQRSGEAGAWSFFARLDTASCEL